MPENKQDEIIAALSEEYHPTVAATIRRINKDDLLPAHRKVYDELEKAGGAGLFIYAIPGVSGGMPTIAEPIVDGKKIIVVGENGVRWMEADALRSRATLAEVERAFEPVQDPALLRILESMANASGIVPPKLFASVLPDDLPGGASITREGISFIIIDKDMNKFQMLGVLAHEIGHIAKGHNSIEQVVSRHNSRAISQAHELE